VNNSNPADCSAPLMRFILPTARSDLSPHTRVYLTRYVPLPGFLNLLVVFSSNHPVVLFHTTGTHGMSSTEFSPRTSHHTFIGYDTCHFRLVFTGEGTSANSVELPPSTYPKVHKGQMKHPQQASTLKSVHFPHRCYSMKAADTLLSILTPSLRSV